MRPKVPYEGFMEKFANASPLLNGICYQAATVKRVDSDLKPHGKRLRDQFSVRLTVGEECVLSSIWRLVDGPRFERSLETLCDFTVYQILPETLYQKPSLGEFADFLENSNQPFHFIANRVEHRHVVAAASPNLRVYCIENRRLAGPSAAYEYSSRTVKRSKIRTRFDEVGIQVITLVLCHRLTQRHMTEFQFP